MLRSASSISHWLKNNKNTAVATANAGMKHQGSCRHLLYHNSQNMYDNPCYGLIKVTDCNLLMIKRHIQRFFV